MNSEEVSQLKVLRIVRLLRLIKLLRIFRSARIFRRIQTSLGLSFSTFSMFKLLAYVMMAVHWCACLWNLAPSLEDQDENWHTELAPDFDAGELYIASLEFSLQAMVMGYGDFTPITHLERGVAVFCMLAGGAVYAYVIGDICGVVANRDPATADYEQSVDLLNQYMEEHQLPQELRVKLRQYFIYCKDLIRGRYYKELLEKMSPALKGTVTYFLNGEWIAKVSFFNADNEEERRAFVTALSSSLEPSAYSPNEVLFMKGDAANCFFIITRGMVGTMGRVKKKEDFFGTDMIAGLILKDPRRDSSARALTYLDVNTLSLEALEEILDSGEFKETTKLIRRAAIKVALRRTVLEMTRRYREAMRMPMSDQASRDAWKEEMMRKREEKLKKIVNSPRSTMARENRAASFFEEKEIDEAELKRRRRMSVLDWWQEEQGQEAEENGAEDCPVIVAQVNTPQLDAVMQRLIQLEHAVTVLTGSMEQSFEFLQASRRAAASGDGDSTSLNLPPIWAN